MKCLVVSVLVIVAVVFTVNCRDFPGEHEGSSSQAERMVEETPDTEHEVLVQPQGRRTNNSQQLVQTDIALPHHKERVEDHENDIRKSNSKCRASSSCVIMGGSCIDNAVLCEGRSVAGCKGKQCQCCVPEPVNICVSESADNSSFWRKIVTAEESLKTTYNQGNKNVTYDIEMRIDTLEMQLKIKMDNQSSNMDDTLTNLANHLYTNLTNVMGDTVANHIGDIEIKLQANSVEIANLTHKLDYIITHLQGSYLASRCSAVNGFMSPSEDECFVFFDARRNWADADTKCKESGLQLAKPENHNAIWLRKYVVENTGATDWIWFGGQGDGTYMRWVLNGEILHSTNSFWWPGQPGSGLSTSFCLCVLTTAGWMNAHPTKGYYSIDCSHARQYICELL